MPRMDRVSGMVFEKYRSRISPIQKQPILDGLIIYLRVQQFGAIVRVSEVLVCECECKLTWGKWGRGGEERGEWG